MGERDPSTHWLGGRVSSRACWDAGEKDLSPLEIKARFLNHLVQGWAIVLARGPLCGSGGWRKAAPFKMIAFIS
jgi:hypothetical protein